MSTAASDIFLLIDGHAVIYRAFYAFPKNLTDQTGQAINAVYGFTRIILTAINNFSPKYMAVTFDHPTPTFRHQEFAAYKAQRPEMPDELKPQIAMIKQVVQTLNIPAFELAGFEADDLIGTISDKLNKIKTVRTIIVTGDQDTFQLVDDNTHVWLPGRGKFQQDKEYDAKAVKDKLGVPPDLVVDYKALVGDSSDNIPGVKGIGPKTAVSLLQVFGNLEAILAAVDKVTAGQKATLPVAQQAVLSDKVVEKISTNKDNALLSRQLAIIDRVVALNFDLTACLVNSYDKTAVVKLFQDFDFKSLINLLPEDQFEQAVQASLF